MFIYLSFSFHFIASEVFNLALNSMTPNENDIGLMKESHHDIIILTIQNDSFFSVANVIWERERENINLMKTTSTKRQIIIAIEAYLIFRCHFF